MSGCAGPRRLAVGGPLGHPIRVGRGLLRDLRPLLEEEGVTATAFLLVVDRGLARALPGAVDAVAAALEDAVRVDLEGGEASKTWRAAGDCLERFARAGVDRGACLVALGGGAHLDVAGFAASLYRRGIRHVALPTTLLAQVDAAVGGKCAVDGAEAKNLFGTFHAPALVVVDPSVLASLPPRQLRSGLGEVLKCALLEGERAVALLRGAAGTIAGGEVPEELVTMCLRLKARLVEADPYDRGVRRLLNLGHTIGHALEAACGLGVLAHGEAVAWGLFAEARLAERLGLATSSLAEEILALARPLGLCGGELPTGRRDAEAALRHDKKWIGGRRTFVLLERPGRPRVVEVEDERAIRWALEALPFS